VGGRVNMGGKKKLSTKKPGPAKCRYCRGLIEGGKFVKIGGRKWHRECALKAGKKIPREYAEI
jgi:hypothetical protein